MNRSALGIVVLLPVIFASCTEAGVSRPSTVSETSDFVVGTYQLVEFSIVTDFNQEITQDDFATWSGTLQFSNFLLNQVITKEDIDESMLTTYFLNYDNDDQVSGTLLLDPILGFSSIHFELIGSDLVIEYSGTTSLGVNYVETDRWRKVSDEP